MSAVVAEELRSWNKLLPQRWGDISLVEDQATVVSWFRSLSRRDVVVEHEEVLLARKLGRGSRPVALLGLQERLLYRSAVTSMQLPGAEQLRSRTRFEEFQHAPLAVEGCTHVLKTDIAAYYQYIDHERLVDEVVAQTGDDLGINLAVELLFEASGRRFGLPQMSAVSDALAEVYIDPVRRDLVRGGYLVSRFADDFRVACRSYDEALQALEATEQAARALGLVLNELKTSTPGAEKYRSSLTAAEDRERALFDELEIESFDAWDLESYGDSETLAPERPDALLDEPDFSEADLGSIAEREAEVGATHALQLVAAKKVLDIWTDEEEDDEVQRSEAARITATLLGRALRVLTREEDPTAIPHVAAMLIYEPSLTPVIARYLMSCAVTSRVATRKAIDSVCRNRVVSGWQALWIAHVAGSLGRVKRGSTFPHVEWLRAQAEGHRPALAAESILALARRGLATESEILAVMDRLSSIHRPTALLALASTGNEKAAMDAAESKLDRVRVAWGLENL